MIKLFVLATGIFLFMFSCLIRGELENDHIGWPLIVLSVAGLFMIFIGAYWTH